MNKNKREKNYSLNLNTTDDYILVSKKILPKVIDDVLKAKKILDEEGITILEAVKKVGISRTSFYKYCDTVFTFDNFVKEGALKIHITVNDKVGVLSEITKLISKHNYNILTANQDEPLDGISDITISIAPKDNATVINKVIDDIKKHENVRKIKLMGLEKTPNKK